MPLLLKILGIKIVGTAISIVVFLTKTGPGFTPANIMHKEDTLIIETTLKKAFTEGLDEIMMSGTEVGIFYSCTFLERDADGFITPLGEVTVYQYLIYDPASDSFRIHTNRPCCIPGHDLDRAQQMITSITLSITPLPEIVPGHEYAAKVTGSLNTIKIEAIEADNFDLNAFWNFKYPQIQTEWIPAEELLAP
jgi:hypothetical protein